MENNITMSFVIVPEQKAALEAWAKEEDRSLSSLLRAIIDGSLRCRDEALRSLLRPATPLVYPVGAEG